MPAVIALVLVALLARVIGLDTGLWIDEVYSLVNSFRLPFARITTEFWGDGHHPLYAVFAHASLATFGEAPWTVRLPALLFGVASIPALWQLGRDLVPRREALLAAALLAVSYPHVWFSQNARGYTMLAFFTLVSTRALLLGLQSGRRREYVLYGVMAGLGVYTHLTMALVVAGQALAAAIDLLARPQRPRLWNPLLGFVTATATAAILYAPMAGAAFDFFTNRPSGLVGVSTPGWALQEALRALSLGLGAGGVVLSTVLVAGAAVVGLLGFSSLATRHRAAALCFSLPVVTSLLGALAARGTMYPRFFFFAIGPALIVAVRGVFEASNWLVRRVGASPDWAPRLATTAVLVVLTVSTASLERNYRYPKQDFKGAMEWVLAHRAAGDQVVSAGVPDQPYRTLYNQPWPNVATAAELESVRARGGRTWVLYTFERYLESGAPEVAAVVRRECSRQQVFRGTVGGGDIVVCVLEAM
ncbi:MAG: glycosyltransferase family 39 protein [Vicinamibacterales bacterium]